LSMPTSRGLFSRAIMLSGGFVDWAAIPMTDSEQLYDLMVKKTGCDKFKDCLMKGPPCQCLLNLPAAELVKHQPGWGWGPTVDGTELPYHPIEALERGKVHKGVPVIIGGTTGDTTFEIDASATDLNFMEFLQLPSSAQGLGLSKHAAETAKSLYLDEAKEELGRSRAYWAARRVKADITMNCPASRVNQLWNISTGGCGSYWYLWETPAPGSHAAAPQDEGDGHLHIGSCWPCPGAGHGDDIPYIFRTPGVNENNAKAKLADNYQVFLKNFMDNADPNLWDGFLLSDMTTHGPAWPQVQEGGMRFHAGEVSFDGKLLKKQCAFWASEGK